MYELVLSGDERKRFVRRIRSFAKSRKISIKQIAADIERPVSTVYQFLSNSNANSRFVAAELAEWLRENGG